MERTCLHRFVGDCRVGCARDYEPIASEHPRNNLDCRKYYEIHIILHEVIREEEEKELIKWKVHGI